MAPSSRSASPTHGNSLSSFLGPAVITNDVVPSISDLNDLSKTLRSYKAELSERSSRIDRESARVGVYGAVASGSSSSSKVRTQSQSKSTTDASLLPSAFEMNRVKSSPAPAAVDLGRSLSATRRQSGSAASRTRGSSPAATTPPPPPSIASSGHSKSKELRVTPSGGSKGKGVEKLPAGEDVSPMSSPSPVASSGHASRPKVIKIKRERDRSGSLLTDLHASTSAASPPGSIQRSTTIDLEDDAPPSGPGRTYAKNKRRQRSGSGRLGSALLDSEDDEGEDFKRRAGERSPSVGSPYRRSNAEASQMDGASSQRGPSRPLGIRLKLNPQQAPSGIAALGSAHQPTGLRPGYPPSAGGSDGSGFIWTLPEEPASLIPAPPISRPPKPYPTRPDDVDEDFTAMDWKERERQKDREEALTSTVSASASPAPGQTHLHKEPPGAAISNAAANRVRSQNQQQVTHQTFQTYVDSWFKSLTEEDVAWLGRQEDDLEPFQIPEIGRHYKEIWEEEDANGIIGSLSYPGAPALTAPLNGARGQAFDKPKPLRVGPFDPRQLADEHAFGTSAIEAKGGPLTERILSLVLPTASPTSGATDGHQTTGGADQQPQVNGLGPSSTVTNGHGAPNGSSSLPAVGIPPPHSQNMAQYEERLKQELRFLDILGADEEVDWANRQDDEISTTLRKVQGLLSKQMKINDVRKARLKQLAEGRLAYQDYLNCLTNVEKVIEQHWYKRQSLLKKFVSKKKGAAKASGGGTGPNRTTTAVPVLNEHNTRSGTPSSASALAGNAAVNAASALLANVVGSTATREGSSTLPASGIATPIGNPSSPAPAPASLLVPPTTTSTLTTDVAQASSMDPADPYATYNALATNRLGVPPLAPALIDAMRSREMLKRALEPIFPAEVKRVPTTSIYQDLEIAKIEIEE